MDQAQIEASISRECASMGVTLPPEGAGRLAQGVVLPAVRHAEDQHQALRAERDKLLGVRDEIARLIGCKNPEKILHDVRNVLNELSLLQALAQDEE